MPKSSASFFEGIHTSTFQPLTFVPVSTAVKYFWPLGKLEKTTPGKVIIEPKGIKSGSTATVPGPGPVPKKVVSPGFDVYAVTVTSTSRALSFFKRSKRKESLGRGLLLKIFLLMLFLLQGKPLVQK